MGLDIAYRNEGCTFVMKKPKDYEFQSVDFVFDENLSAYSGVVLKHVKKQELLARFGLSRVHRHNALQKCKSLIKKPIKIIYNVFIKQ